MNYTEFTSIENLFQAWIEFRRGKRNRSDVQEFEFRLEDNLFSLRQDLRNRTYQHGFYQAFFVHDPKQRLIHKATVRDRIVHHLLYKYLYELFDKTFIYDSYSCRLEKGTHKAVLRLVKFTRIVSKNYTKKCWVLKLDIRKFFASVDHVVLENLISKRIQDQDILWLLKQVIVSFCSCHSLLDLDLPDEVNGDHKGIPLGNLTSQIFANIYMNELDQFIKHRLKAKCYLRYADDFLIVFDNQHYDKLVYHSELLDTVKLFLRHDLKLELHPKKIVLRKLSSGIDFLGYIVLSHYILPRTKTKRRMFKKLAMKSNSDNFNQSLNSYLGYLSHCSSYKVSRNLRSLYLQAS